MKIKWNREAFEQIRRAPGIVADLNARAGRIAEAAGPGFEPGSYEGKTRHRASVITATAKAKAQDAKHHTILRSVDAGR
ncbi:hypothetical protein [Corynebacterium lactis]|uniref:Uncharacterized protein n=1 Tax=Corynebacterium lactis RW2-5 TaxID=1408189 RepID=A0A0K2H0I8_9CORY|nr:hypothetical protein [Corynebacterium lactis]ALA67562.1 hypothetical protein CLAC_07310 [Corynebacterium lactis RW2-5]